MTGLPKQCFHCYWNHHQHAFHWTLRELEADPPQKDFLGVPQITSFPLCLVSITGAPRQVDIRSPCTRLSICTHSACLHAFLTLGNSSIVLFYLSTEVRNILINQQSIQPIIHFHFHTISCTLSLQIFYHYSSSSSFKSSVAIHVDLLSCKTRWF